MVNPNDAARSITWEEFSEAITSNGYPAPSRGQYTNFKNGLSSGQITYKREAAMALAQLIHESGGLRLKRETVPDNLRCGRCSRGDCATCYARLGGHYRQDGDPPGKYYYGRGYIQLTWSYNYRAASTDLGLGDQLFRDPDAVANNDDLSWKTAFSYWKREVHNAPGVAQGHFGSTTRAINGALECDGRNTQLVRQRFNIYCQVYRAFNIDGEPNPASAGC